MATTSHDSQEDVQISFVLIDKITGISQVIGQVSLEQAKNSFRLARIRWPGTQLWQNNPDQGASQVRL